MDLHGDQSRVTRVFLGRANDGGVSPGRSDEPAKAKNVSQGTADGRNGGVIVNIVLNPNSIDDYRTFLKAKSLPQFRCVGYEVRVPNEYADRLGEKLPKRKPTCKYSPLPGLFDYQAAIARLAIEKRKFAVFMECGYGKDLIMKEFARYCSAALPRDKKVLMLSPLMVVEQAVEETQRWYGDSFEVEQIAARDLSAWLTGDGLRVGICNYEALNANVPQGQLGALICDESSIMKSHYGKWGQECLRLGAGLEYKLCLTGTPAPNDRIEFANHAVFLDAFPTVNAFLARYFINRGQTQERWVLKPHALESFYRDLSHWCIFVQNPGTYGWKDNAKSIPEIKTIIHDIDLTKEQADAVYKLTGRLFLGAAGGITTRAKLSQIGKGYIGGKKIATNKPTYIKHLVESFGDRSTIIWCHFNNEQDEMERLFPQAVSIRGDTARLFRLDGIKDFQQGRRKILISKGKVMQFGMNLQVCTRMIFNSLHDSWEEYHQCVKRANRVGSTEPLEAHLPVSEVERPMMETILEKAHRIDADLAEQERIYKDKGLLRWAS
jgi:hypothetical protein